MHTVTHRVLPCLLQLVSSTTRLETTMTQQHGFICKRCGTPSPLGIGYVDNTPGAGAASAAVKVCKCGQSHSSDKDPNSLRSWQGMTTHRRGYAWDVYTPHGVYVVVPADYRDLLGRCKVVNHQKRDGYRPFSEQFLWLADAQADIAYALGLVETTDQCIRSALS